MIRIPDLTDTVRACASMTTWPNAWSPCCRPRPITSPRSEATCPTHIAEQPTPSRQRQTPPAGCTTWNT